MKQTINNILILFITTLVSFPLVGQSYTNETLHFNYMIHMPKEDAINYYTNMEFIMTSYRKDVTDWGATYYTTTFQNVWYDNILCDVILCFLEDECVLINVVPVYKGGKVQMQVHFDKYFERIDAYSWKDESYIPFNNAYVITIYDDNNQIEYFMISEEGIYLYKSSQFNKKG